MRLPSLSLPLLPEDFNQHRGIYATATFLVVISAVFALSYLPKLQAPIQLQSYEECVKQPKSVIQEKYPAVCVTEDGQQFTQPTPTPSASEEVTQSN